MVESETSHWWLLAALFLVAAGCGGSNSPRSAPVVAVVAPPAERTRPTSTFAVELVPAALGLTLPDSEIRVTLVPKGMTAVWRPGRPAAFTGLDPEENTSLEVTGEQAQYLLENDGQIRLHPATPTTVRVVPLVPIPELGREDPDPWVTDKPTQKLLYVDTTAGNGPWVLTWREREIAVGRAEIPSSVAALAHAAIEQWMAKGSHRAPADPLYDQVVLVVPPDAKVENLIGLLEALQGPRRHDPGGNDVPAFRIRVTLASTVAPPPAPPAPPALTEAEATVVTNARVKLGAMWMSGILARDQVEQTLERQRERWMLCYQRGLLREPTLNGRVSVRFVIGRDGLASQARNGGSDLPDPDVVKCVADAVNGLRFQEPQTGIVIVVYPLLFAPR